MGKGRWKRLWLGLAALLLAALIGYTVFDNHRFVVREEEVALSGLPEAFDGFRLVQVSDLHNARFGQNQKDLIQALNGLRADAFAFTGDMGRSSTGAFDALEALLDGLDEPGKVYWVDGNHGPYAMQAGEAFYQTSLSDYGRSLEARGVHVLTEPQPITRGDDRLWITPELSRINVEKCREAVRESADREALLAGEEAYIEWIEALDGNGEVKILLHHYPYQTDLSEGVWESWGQVDYSLILAGHYHGGQVRLPFVGAVYVPSGTKTLFPRPESVRWWSQVGGAAQYISAGLGSSDPFPLSGWRFLCTPEVNVITLRRKA